MLKLEHLKKSYPGFLLDCSLSIEPGQITGIIGPNGAGKSTMFKSILGLVHLDSGSIRLFGKDLRELQDADRAKLGAALAETGLSGELTVEDAVRILRAFYPAFDEPFFRRKCDELGLPRDKQIKNFSTGMKAKLKVLVAVSHKAQMLILDEPTAGLDVLARDQTLSLLREYMEQDDQRAILISSHISNDLESICDDFYMLNDGRIVFHEDTDKLMSDYAIIKLDEEQLSALDQRYILRRLKENYGYRLLTDQRRYYRENYPNLVVERASMDEFIMLMLKGEAL